MVRALDEDYCIGYGGYNLNDQHSTAQRLSGFSRCPTNVFSLGSRCLAVVSRRSVGWIHFLKLAGHLVEVVDFRPEKNTNQVRKLRNTWKSWRRTDRKVEVDVKSCRCVFPRMTTTKGSAGWLFRCLLLPSSHRSYPSLMAKECSLWKTNPLTIPYTQA